MGVAVSSWPLARAVSRTGQLGVVSGTALDIVLARRLQLGDPEGHLRRALAAFPNSGAAERILDRYFIPGGKDEDAPFRPMTMHDVQLTRDAEELLVAANFVEVYLAKEDHEGQVGINYLEKIQLPTLPSLFGAMLAGVDYVIMGAGIPRAIPGILDRLAEGQPVELALNVEGAKRTDTFVTQFDPSSVIEEHMPFLERPRFLAVVASATLATMLVRKASGCVDGFVVEGPTAGGHNAPPRGTMQLNDRGEPVYGDRDVPDLRVFRELGRPFWLAGSHGSAEHLAQAMKSGAAGVQVGTAFAFCEESGLRADIKQRVLAMSRAGTTNVKSDPAASPAGFPFKVLSLPGSLSDEQCYEQRKRVCDLGYLRQLYRRDDGTVGTRCPAEKPEVYVSKGGDPEATSGRKCVCNGLIASVAMGQVRKHDGTEPPLVTCGDDVCNVAAFLPTPDAECYSAGDVVRKLLSQVDLGTDPPTSESLAVTVSSTHGTARKPAAGVGAMMTPGLPSDDN
jgi:nitronate monooxygenase